MKQAVFKINKNSTNNEKYLSVKNNNSNNSNSNSNSNNININNSNSNSNNSSNSNSNNSNSNSIYSQKPRKIVENIYYFKR